MHGHIVLGNQLMSADALAKIPNADNTGTIATDQFSLVRVDHDIVDSRFMNVVALKAACTRVPDLHSAILGASHHPLPLAMERHPSDIAGVAIECHHRVRVGGLDVVKLHIAMSSCGQIALVGRDAEAVDLRIRVLNSTGANARKCLPKAAFAQNSAVRNPIQYSFFELPIARKLTG